MPEIEATIDTETGELTLHIRGVPGPACEEVLEELRALLGAPTTEQETAEYRLRPQVRVQTKQGR